MRLRGMFALAIWDGRTRTLIAARDRAGEKPLYWTQTAQGLLLASEVKALLVRPEVSRELDPIALDQFLTYEYVLAPRTMLKGVHKVPPAHFLKYRDGQATVHRYWDAADVPLRDWNDADAAEALRAALKTSVERQLMADVPLGAFLSGGIDSSSIVALMSASSSQPVNTFSIGFSDGTYNELPYAREVAALFKTNHRERHGVAGSRRHVRAADRASRRAVRRRVAVPDLQRVGAGARARQGACSRATAATSCSAATTRIRRRRWRRSLAGWATR